MARSLVVIQPVSDVLQDEEITPAPAVAVYQDGVLDADLIDGEVSLTLEDNEEGAVLLGPTTARVSGGIAEFPNLSVDKPGSYRLVASCDEATLEYPIEEGLNARDALFWMSGVNRMNLGTAGGTFAELGAGTFSEVASPAGPATQCSGTAMLESTSQVAFLGAEYTIAALVRSFTSDSSSVEQYASLMEGTLVVCGIEARHASYLGTWLVEAGVRRNGYNLPTNEWRLVHIRRRTGTNLLDMYSNGTWVGGITGAASPPITAAGAFRVGGAPDGPGTWAVAQAAIWNRALTEGEILEQARRCGVAP